jgi:hypothetical protein
MKDSTTASTILRTLSPRANKWKYCLISTLPAISKSWQFYSLTTQHKLIIYVMADQKAAATFLWVTHSSSPV